MLGWILLLVGSVACFFILEMLVFPKCFLESEYSIGKTSDRGIRKYKTATDGMYFLYEPNWFVRQFIKQYVIAVTDEGKTLTCKIEEGIDYLRYDVVLFDASDRVFKILNVQQLIEDRLYTEEVELPPETAYVTLALNQVNRQIFPKVARARVSPRRLMFYGLATCATAAVTAFCMNLSFAHLFGKVFRESYATSVTENIAVLGVALAAAAVCAVMLSLVILLKNKKK